METILDLTQEFIDLIRRRVEEAIVPAARAIYMKERVLAEDGFDPVKALPPDFNPEFKQCERIVSYFDYRAAGISVLAPLAARGDGEAAEVLKRIIENSIYYSRRIYGHYKDPQTGLWVVPLRRLLLHLALAYPHLESWLSADEKKEFVRIVEREVENAIEHNSRFWPGERGWLFMAANNHTAMFAQGIWHCGRVFRRPEWTSLIEDFARRYLDEMHPDGYFDENANAERLDGPSLVYTPLTAGAIFDILDGRENHQAAFLKAGRFHRLFLNAVCQNIPLADERTNYGGISHAYGLALHSLSPQGRHFLADLLGRYDLNGFSPEVLAVLHHELGLMTPGPGAIPEYLQENDVRITMPLGVVRMSGFAAALCGLRATNHEFRPTSDYALDQQSHLYLWHEKAGLILPGTKGKNTPRLSTCRQGDDAYTIATGELQKKTGWARVRAHYRNFDVAIEWHLAPGLARLTFESSSPNEITTALPVSRDAKKYLKTAAPYEVQALQGFSPYSAGNVTDPVRALVFRWTGRLEMEFRV